MSNQKHTPGKWEVYNAEIDNNSRIEIKTDEIISVGVKKNTHRVTVAFCGYERNPEAIANAKLIAAAPELLKVCADLLNAFVHKENDKKGNQTRTDIFKYCPEFGEIAVAARTAINKATE